MIFGTLLGNNRNNNNLENLESLMTLTDSDNSTNTNTTTVVTHASIAAFFPQFDENVGSIVVSCIFLTAYAITLTAIVTLLIRYRKEMKKNQVIVFLLVSWCMIQQSIALAFRLGYNGKALSLNLNYPDYTKIENLSAHLLPMYVCSAFEGLAVYLQGVVIVIITCFILNMFLDTARIAHAMSAKAYKIFKYVFNIIIAIFAVSILLLVFVHVGVILASKVAPNFNVNVFPILIVIFLAFTIMISIESLMFIFVGVKLILFVRKNSLKIGAQANANFLQRAETKISGLIIGMLISAYFQLLAAIVGIMTTTFNSTLHFLDYSFQAGGILLFSIFVLLVYNPLVSFTAKDSNASTDSIKSDNNKSNKSEKIVSEKSLASQRKSATYPTSPIRELDCVSPTTTTSGGAEEPQSESSNKI